MNVGEAGVPLVLLAAPWIVALVGILALGPVQRRWPRATVPLRIGVVACSIAGLGLILYALLADPTPGASLENPVAATEESIAAGGELFQAHCAACHGADARGGGPQAGTTEVRPPSLLSGHVEAHSDGDLFYWITNGLPGGMPAWGDVLSETDRWNVVNYLRALQEADHPDHGGRPIGPTPSH